MKNIKKKLQQICSKDWHYEKLAKTKADDIIQTDYDSLLKIIKESKNIIVVTNLINTDKLLDEFDHKLIPDKYKTNRLFSIYNNKDESIFLVYDALLKIGGPHITTCIIDLNNLDNYKIYQIENYYEMPKSTIEITDSNGTRTCSTMKEFIDYLKTTAI